MMQENKYVGLFVGADRNQVLHGIISDMFSVAKETPREHRIVRLRLITDAFIHDSGKCPDSTSLERMATLILNEEITDPNEHKMMHNEFPIMSATQEVRRKTGLHARKGTVQGGEVSFAWASDFGTNGVEYRPQTRDTNRKMRGVSGGHLRDKDVHARNKARRKAYREFTKTQPVHTYHIQ